MKNAFYWSLLEINPNVYDVIMCLNWNFKTQNY